ncbi:MAG: hypothetical protein AAFZ58_03785 [Pseudomonadota bacterium]
MHQLGPCTYATAALAAATALVPAYAAENEHSETPHHLSALFAATDNTEDTAFTLGVDYEYRISQFLGIGAVAEHAFADVDATTVLVVADLHFGEHLAIQTGPGLEWIDEESGSEREFVYRVGALYEVEMGSFTFSPQLHVDFTANDDSVVAGVAFGFAF